MPEDNKPFSISWGPGVSAGLSAGGHTYTSGASTDLQIAMRHAEALVAGLRGEMTGELAKVAASLERTEDRLTLALKEVPQLGEIKRENRRAIGWAVGIVIAALALLWTVFGVGASITSGVTDHVVSIKDEQKLEVERDARIENKLDQLLRNSPDGQPQQRR